MPLGSGLLPGTPTITVQVLPFSAGAHAAESNGFIILRGPEPGLDVVHLSSLVGALYLEKRTDLERHWDVFNHLRSQAMGPNEPCEMIACVGDQFVASAQKES